MVARTSSSPTFSGLALLAAGLLGLAAAPLARAQGQDFSKVEIRSEKLAEGLYMLAGAGGNIALLSGADGPVLVDDEFAPLAPKIRAAVALVTDKPVRFVLNTHWHFDHTGGNEPFGRAGSLIIAHENTRNRLSSRQLIAFFKVETLPAPPEALPVITFADGLTLHLDGEQIDLVHVPAAHTDSDVVIYFRHANVVHTGDVFVRGSYPFIDESSGGTLDGVIAASASILAKTDGSTRIVPGHGSLSTRTELAAYHDMLVTVRGRIVELIRKGRTEEQVLAAAPTRDFDERFGGGGIKPDVWVQRVYVELKRAAMQGARAAGRPAVVPK